jgi:endoglucanase Acf2
MGQGTNPTWTHPYVVKPRIGGSQCGLSVGYPEEKVFGPPIDASGRIEFYYSMVKNDMGIASVELGNSGCNSPPLVNDFDQLGTSASLLFAPNGPGTLEFPLVRGMVGC